MHRFPLVAILLGCLFAGPALADSPRVALETSLGRITLELDQDRAPVTVENFLRYVDEGFYNGTVFHRVIDGFMIQGGGFTEALERKTTGPGIRNEADNGLRNDRFTVAMARTQAPHSATAQFFINTDDNDFLNHKAPSGSGWGYAVFGRVVDGTDVVEDISTVETAARAPLPRDVPVKNIVITRAYRITQ